MLTDDDLKEWRAHPITARVMEALRKVGEARKAQALEAYWHSGEANPRQVDRARVFLALCDDMMEATAGAVNEWNKHKRD